MTMPPIVLNSLWSVLAVVLAAFGVTYEPTPAVKAVVAAAGALVVAVVQWQQHRTIRHHVSAAAGVALAKAQRDTAQAQQSPAVDAQIGRLLAHVGQLAERVRAVETTDAERHPTPGPIG